MGNDRFAKKVYVGESAGSCPVDWPLKRWIYTVKEYLIKRHLYVRKAIKQGEWQGFVRGTA